MTSTSYSYSSWSNDQARAGDLDSTGVTGISNVTLSAHFKYSIYCSDGGFCSSSDERIKHDISDVNDNLALDVIRKIEPKYYNYIDKFSRHQYRTIGFIAQQVNEYFPEAIKFTTKCIPNVMKNLTDITWTAFTDTEEDTVKYKLTCTLIDVKTGEIISDINGINYKFYVNDDSNQSDEKELLIPGNSDNTFIFAKKWDNIFCYGAEVNDFHTLEKEKIFTLYHSAIQEIDKQQQIDKQNITTLQNEVTTLTNKNTTLENENTTLKADVLSLQNELASIKEILQRNNIS